jgi:micrococcal nuclease
MENNLWHYKALVTRVYDGDTITVDIDLGFNMVLRDQSIRLSGIDTPEIRGDERPEGLISGNALRERILNKNVIIVTDKDETGKYGRWLGTIYYNNENLNQWLLNEGLATLYR